MIHGLANSHPVSASLVAGRKNGRGCAALGRSTAIDMASSFSAGGRRIADRRISSNPPSSGRQGRYDLWADLRINYLLCLVKRVLRRLLGLEDRFAALIDLGRPVRVFRHD